MKALLGCLMFLVLTTSQGFAISGGPWGRGTLNVVGVYAGVLKPKIPPVDDPPGCSANSIGVFSVGVPSSGVSTGTFVMFSQGRVFTGTIQGVADPGKGTLNAVLSASLNFTVTFSPTPCPSPVTTCTESSTTEQVTATANGNLNASVFNAQSQSGNATGSTRLRGGATIDISHGTVDSVTLAPIVECEMTLHVGGFKQTDTAQTSTTTTTTTG